MTFSLSVTGSRREAPYHPFQPEQAAAFDQAVKDFAAALTAAGLQGTIGGSRPGTQAEYEGRPRVQYGGNEPTLDTGNAQVSVTF